MQIVDKQVIMTAVIVYEEKPRDQWLFNYPAQMALTSTQIWWTTDVRIAFDHLDKGFEIALKDYYKNQVSFLCLEDSWSHLYIPGE